MRHRLAGLLLMLCVAAAHADGQRIYNRECVACHMAEGRGAPGVAPPLHGRLACIARRPGGRDYLAGVLKHGLEGPITVDGVVFDGYMPATAQVSSDDKAAVLNYLLSLGADCTARNEPFTAAEVDAALNGKEWNSQSMLTLREQVMAAPAAQAPAAHGGAGELHRPARQDARLAQAAEDFTRHCQGCHTPRGDAVPGQVPMLRENVGLFVHIPEGRAFLLKVPGVAFAPLDDQRLADLLNWMVLSMSAAELPAPFIPYSAAEVAAYRRQPFSDVDAERMQVVAQLERMGLQTPE